MKIAAITITYNDDYKINEWYEHYNEYKDELYLHIIVDNNSNKDYLNRVKGTFIESHIIERNSNGGCTGAYNDGIKYALSLPEVDAIMLVGNDVKLKVGASVVMHKTLFSDAKLGMVSPILLGKSSDIVEDFGCTISSTLMMVEYGVGLKINEVQENLNYCEAVPGGMNMAKREFYEKVGLQDDNLFMYSDEVDMGLRAKKSGYTMAAISEAISWHQHINETKQNGRRHPFTKYLMGRNKVYVAKKHFGFLKVLFIFLFYFLGAFYRILQNIFKGNFNLIKEYSWVMFGSGMGLLGNMKPNRFSVSSEYVELQK